MAAAGLKQIQNWAKPFLPQGMKVIFSDGSFSRALDAAKGDPKPAGVSESAEGWMFLADKNLLIIEANAQKFYQGFMGDTFSKAETQQTRKKFSATLAHEFGHGIAATQLEQAPKDVQEAIYAEYEQHLKEAVDGTDLKGFVSRWFNSTESERLVTQINETLAKADKVEKAGDEQ